MRAPGSTTAEVAPSGARREATSFRLHSSKENTETASIAVGANVAPGTVVSITARVAMLNHDCPDAYAVEVPITVH